MTVTRRRAIAVLAGAATAGSLPSLAFGDDAITLVEEVKPGDCFRCEVGLSVTGKMTVDRGGKTDTLPLAAKARHVYTERADAAAALRLYSDAASETVVGVDKSRRALGADRRLVAAQRATDGTVHYSPDGPLTRDELDLVAEHFDTLCLPGLLPGKAVKVGDTWPIPDEVAQAACLFHGLVKNQLAGKLVEVKGTVATFSVEGKAEGVEHGAAVRVEVSARGAFDLAAKRVTGLTWKQADGRDQGPVSPPLEVSADVTLTRAVVAEPKELTAAAAKLPADGKIPEALTHLRYADAAGRFRLLHARDWHAVVQNDAHLVLRLVEKGEMVTQATLTEWKKPTAGADFAAAAKEFRDATTKQPGWEATKLIDEGTLPADGGRKIFRMVAAGKQDGLQVVQAFHLVVGPAGQHVAVTVLTRAEALEKLTDRDVKLVTAVEFPTGK